MNEFYSAPNSPIDYTTAKSAPIRAQWEAIEAAFDKLDGRITFLVAGGTANALTVTMGNPPESYEEGLMFNVKITTTNTGAATMNVNGLGAQAIVARDGSPLEAGDLVADSVETLFYVSGRFMIRAVAGAQGPQGPTGDVEEAPEDGTPYSRQDAGWVATPAGPEGPAGADGADGNTILYGEGAPGSGTGNDGDFYIATDTNTIYGPKDSGAWPAGTSMIGPQGPAGAQGATGATGPEGPAGADGSGSTWGDLGDKPAKLVNFAALTGGANKLPYFDGTDTLTQADITAFGLSLLAAADGSALATAAGVISVVSKNLVANNGHIKFNVGDGQTFMIQWGSRSIPANGSTVVTYPQAFSSFSVAVMCGGRVKTSSNDENGPYVVSCGAASFTAFSAVDIATTGFWIAVGR